MCHATAPRVRTLIICRVLRLIFPRAVKPTDKTVVFRLYLGGLKFPEREVEFRVKDLTYQGKLEM